ncbi:ATP-grasp domain-containing protein [Eubacterium ventriosum]|uniref:ATP-grasp domain-containing protein n=1 Tax=Eubacterium ventriosum TaxID=39496 RepID=UPI00399B080A
MKKLLLLGGSRYLLPVIEVAHKLGLYVITCDYLPDNIAHKYSDEYINVSIIDKEKVLETAKANKIDGIMSFATDPGVTTAAYVAEKMNLPSCGSYESVSILQDKGRFRKFLEDNNFTVPNARSYTNIQEALEDVEYFNWPVIVKPVDSAGSKGVTKVEKKEKLEESIKYALEFSHSNKFIIEDFIEKKGCSSDTDCFSVDGKLVVTTFSSQRFDEKADNPYAPMAYSWPSTFSKESEEELHSEIQRLLTLLNMKTSIYNVETREGIDGKAYIMEVSPRGGGNRLAEMIRYATGMDLIESAVKAAVGDSVIGLEQKKYDGYWAEYVLHSFENGKFKELYIEPQIRENNLKELDLWVNPGDEVHTFTAANYAIGTVVLKFNSKDEMETIMRSMNEKIKVIVEEDK